MPDRYLDADQSELKGQKETNYVIAEFRFRSPSGSQFLFSKHIKE
jgi:hypothetical protein